MRSKGWLRFAGTSFGRAGAWTIRSAETEPLAWSLTSTNPKKGVNRGVGIFMRPALPTATPTSCNSLRASASAAKACSRAGPNDKFGIGYYFINVNNPTIHGPLQSRKFLRAESGLEAFYDVALTPWLFLTPDLQVLTGLRRRRPGSSKVR
jgi:Carbohydrate-selective porin, OprB family